MDWQEGEAVISSDFWATTLRKACHLCVVAPALAGLDHIMLGPDWQWWQAFLIGSFVVLAYDIANGETLFKSRPEKAFWQ